MALALTLGQRGLGRVWPNPAVGCVIVNGGRVVGRGWTSDGGRPHAETMALAQAGHAARGADVFVTLEPCAHHGQTPPCAAALIAAGVARVVIACTDPDPRVAGRGAAMLQAAGIAVQIGIGAAQALRDHAGFFSRITAGRPMVTLKLANTLDGRIATANGESRWITGAQARRAVHALRARHDAVMVGAGTVRADDPRLDVRDLGITRQPVRVVISRALKIPRDCHLTQQARAVPLWLCHGAGADVAPFVALGAVSLPCAVRAGQVDPISALAALGAAGITRVLCEGGGMLAASLLGADLVDEVVVMAAGCAIGAEGTPALAAMGIGPLADAPRFDLLDLRDLGGDVMMHWQRRR